MPINSAGARRQENPILCIYKLREAGLASECAVIRTMRPQPTPLLLTGFPCSIFAPAMAAPTMLAHGFHKVDSAIPPDGTKQNSNVAQDRRQLAGPTERFRPSASEDLDHTAANMLGTSLRRIVVLWPVGQSHCTYFEGCVEGLRRDLPLLDPLRLETPKLDEHEVEERFFFAPPLCKCRVLRVCRVAWAAHQDEAMVQRRIFTPAVGRGFQVSNAIK
mmetsp:Transcript_96808/g.252435  ORF Transcript_96808/g.252435 Transcript_96808/m.252435 type:complete len:218 (+) Transcript_96808:130-783(+)